MKKYVLFSIVIVCVMFGCFNSFAAGVDTLDIQSQVMQKNIKAAVVLPQSYKTTQQNYPVIYLLHGGQGNYRDWLSKTDDKLLLHKLADQYNFIIVTPDAGLMSYYFDSPLDKSSQYETFITKELVEKIDGTYRTIKDRKGRGIAGLSMGGHGAMYLSARHPELYCAAGSMSGVMNINTATWNVPAEFAQLRNKNFEHLLGPPKDAANPYREYSAVGLADKMKTNDVKLIFDCGFDDIMIKPNRELHQLLLANGTPHEYTERPGKHEWPYWSNAVSYQFLFFQKVMSSIR
ncbi:alpha/beta hydrolase family protein [Mucilaginibacter sp. OK283]|uniref:alpha/beta hydrolase n=1 Tax=Mucilaginibacter sp. OK283 TaxID=1881049 RepID=UPI0008C01962|nr:alpha/beta hydrolase family protein [Mucilaginibacter sp. OK283]SEO92836.1 S-formylglutathione hydrolase FrmB [Mucilaginibacter sp. OK283]